MKSNNVDFPDSVGFHCKKCGVCCHMQPPDVSKTEQKRIEEMGFKDFLGSVDENGVRWIKRQADGSCIFLTNENKCAIYTIRPPVCRLEPFTIDDFDYRRNRIELGLNYPFACACRGTCNETTIVSAEEIARAAQILVQKILALTANDLGLPLTHRRVYRETRSRLLRRYAEMANLQV